MNLALVANNIGYVGCDRGGRPGHILMVGIYRTHEAMEAAWKYSLAASELLWGLFRHDLVYMAAEPVIGQGLQSMVWTVLIQRVAEFDPALLNVAFIFLCWATAPGRTCALARLAA